MVLSEADNHIIKYRGGDAHVNSYNGKRVRCVSPRKVLIYRTHHSFRQESVINSVDFSVLAL